MPKQQVWGRGLPKRETNATRNINNPIQQQHCSATMANHYGELHEANHFYERIMPLVDNVLAQPYQAEEAQTILMFGLFWWIR